MTNPTGIKQTIEKTGETLSEGFKTGASHIYGGLSTLGYCVTGAAFIMGCGYIIKRLLKVSSSTKLYQAIKRIRPLNYIYEHKLTSSFLPILPRIQNDPILYLRKHAFQGKEREFIILQGHPGDGKTTLILKWAISLESFKNGFPNYKRKPNGINNRGYKIIYIPCKNLCGNNLQEIFEQTLNREIESLSIFTESLREFLRKTRRRLIFIFDDFEYLINNIKEENDKINAKKILDELVSENLADVLLIFGNNSKIHDFCFQDPKSEITKIEFQKINELEFIEYLIYNGKFIGYEFKRNEAELFGRFIGPNFNILKRFIKFIQVNPQQNEIQNKELNQNLLHEISKMTSLRNNNESIDYRLIKFVTEIINEYYLSFYEKLIRISKEQQNTISEIIKDMLSKDQIKFNQTNYHEFKFLFENNILDHNLSTNLCSFSSEISKSMCKIYFNPVQK